MATHQTFVNQNILIPRGSSITEIVTGRSENVRVTVFVSGPGFVPPTQLNHPQAWNQIQQQRLARRGEYSVIVDIDFLARATVDADLRVIDLVGDTWLAPWPMKLQGTLGDSVTLSYGLSVL